MRLMCCVCDSGVCTNGTCICTCSDSQCLSQVCGNTPVGGRSNFGLSNIGVPMTKISENPEKLKFLTKILFIKNGKFPFLTNCIHTQKDFVSKNRNFSIYSFYL